MKKITQLFCGALLMGSLTSPAQSLFKDLIPGGHPNSSNTEQYKNVGTDMFFLARVNSSNGYIHQLWKSDGTVNGTLKVKDSIFVSNTGSLFIMAGEVNGNLLYFKRSTASSTTTFQLWKSDGTTAGTTMLKQFTNNPLGTAGDPKNYTFVDNTKMFFTVADSAGRELWVSDGTVGGTNRVTDLAPGFVSGSIPRSGAENRAMVSYNGKVYFAGSTTGADAELYSSDGTAGGTTLVYQYVGVSGCDPEHFKVWNNELYFSAFAASGGGKHLFKTDGTTTTQLSTGINASNPLVFNNQLFFIGGFDLWKTDGTPGGTTLITTNVSTSGYAGANNDYFFTKYYTDVYRSDGTAAGTSLASPELAATASFSVIDNIMYKTRFDLGGFTSIGLWKSDGTDAGTSKIHYGTATGVQHIYDNRVFFSETNSASGQELWSFDPLATGIAELIEDKNMIVYPNPTSGMIKIISNASKEAVYEIFDILGNVILKQQDLHEADLSSYAKGMYFIRITDNGDSYTKRIVVK
jgi:ELWxxDGT repeat protein